jgi:2-polyprenyl-3-methyl-5-hydroxy-6-metoxy-1,4-benzoquinol methylase
MNEIVEKLKADYDATPYGDWAHHLAHPDRIAVVAALRGLAPPPVSNCRVLEIACAGGGNLIPMAEQMPSSRFLGIDLSPRQIETGASLVRELGLTNIELRCMDLMDFPRDAGTFDYIIAHGFYSWAPQVVRGKLMEVCRDHLSENGLAYISYNTFPGWRAKSVLRDMMLYHARNAADPAQRVKLGREIVQWVIENTVQKTRYRDMIGEYGKSMSVDADNYLLHDHMEAINEPVYLMDFVAEARTNDLALIGDTNPKDDFWERIPPAVRESISKASDDIVERDQYMDFLTNRAFRRSVLCRAEAAAAMPDAASARDIAAGQIRKMYIAGNPPEKSTGMNAAGRAIVQFGNDENQVHLSDPRPIAAMRHLCRAWPSAVPFVELVATAAAQAPAGPGESERVAVALARVIEICYSVDILELWTRPTDHISPTGGTFPRATRWARWQAAHLHVVTSLRSRRVAAEDLDRQILPLADGTRDRDAMAAELAKQAQATSPVGPDPLNVKQVIDKSIQKMASASLFLGEHPSPDGHNR